MQAGWHEEISEFIQIAEHFPFALLSRAKGK
jgi:hypothetical protein